MRLFQEEQIQEKQVQEEQVQEGVLQEGQIQEKQVQEEQIQEGVLQERTSRALSLAWLLVRPDIGIVHYREPPGLLQAGFFLFSQYMQDNRTCQAE